MDIKELQRLKKKRLIWFLIFTFSWLLGSYSFIQFKKYDDKILELDKTVLE